MAVKNTIEACVRFDIIMAKSGIVVHEDEVWVNVDKEQYDRMKASHDTGIFKQMNWDIDLVDICEVFSNAGKTAEGQVLLLDYPVTVINGMTFEEVLRVQKEGFTDEEWAGLFQDFMEEIGEETDEIAEQAYKEALLLAGYGEEDS